MNNIAEESVRPESAEAESGEGGEVNAEDVLSDSGIENDTDAEREPLEAKPASVPRRPNREKIESHMLTQLQFRSWCKHCVRGKSKGKPHCRIENK